MSTAAETGIPATSAFRVEIDGIVATLFDTVDGIGADVEVVKFSGSTGNILSERPSRYEARNLHLTRRFAGKDDFHDWFRRSASVATPQTKAGSIVILSGDRDELARMKFTGSWVKSWSGPRLGGIQEGVAFLTETFVLSVEDIEVAL